MSKINEINELVARLRGEEKERVLLGVISLTEYPTLLALNEVNKSFSPGDDGNKELDNDYEKCLSIVKEINEIAEKTINKKIYEGSYERKDVEYFMLELLSDTFNSRGIRRR